MTHVMTIFAVKWGIDKAQTQVRYFRPENGSDAALRFGERILELDADKSVSAAWVSLTCEPDSVHPEGTSLAFWTKTSDERKTREGVKTIAELY